MNNDKPFNNLATPSEATPCTKLFTVCATLTRWVYVDIKATSPEEAEQLALSRVWEDDYFDIDKDVEVTEIEEIPTDTIQEQTL